MFIKAIIIIIIIIIVIIIIIIIIIIVIIIIIIIIIRTSRDKINGLHVCQCFHRQCGERRLPMFNPGPGQDLNQGPSGWQSEILPTVLNLHTQNYTTGT